MGPSPGDVTSLLNKLADGDPQAAAQLVPLVSSKTVMREWKMAKAWLYGDLKERQRDDAR
jgi:hypothetical protein